MQKKILIIVTNCASYPNGTATGLWLGELVHFYNRVTKAGYEVEIASPKGGNIPLDPEGFKWYVYDKETKEFYKDENKMALLKNTKPASGINADDFLAIYFTGGHGTMWDFPNDAELNDITSRYYADGRIVAAVCHGTCGVLNVKHGDSYMIKNKKITGYSWVEEKLVRRKNWVPFNLQEEVGKRGASYKKALFPFVSHVVKDGNIITGQNPQSAKAVGKEVVNALYEKEGNSNSYRKQNIFNKTDYESIIARIDRLQDDTRHIWGKMDVKEMLAHCIIQLQIGLGEIPTQRQGSPMLRTWFGRKIGLYGPRWKKGVSTPDEMNIHKANPTLREVINSKKQLIDYIDKVRKEDSFERHPFFGELNKKDWGRLIWKHLDHHLSQFGV